MKSLNLTVSDSLIQDIKEREQSFEKVAYEHIIAQGKDLMELMKEEDKSQNKVAELVGMSKGSVSNYINIAKDKKINSVQSVEQLQHFNQNDLVKMTKMDTREFNATVKNGEIKSKPKPKPTKPVEPVIEAEIEPTDGGVYEFTDGVYQEGNTEELNDFEYELGDTEYYEVTVNNVKKYLGNDMDSKTLNVIEYFLDKLNYADDSYNQLENSTSKIIEELNNHMKEVEVRTVIAEAELAQLKEDTKQSA